MDKDNYLQEVERQLNNETYYEKLDMEFSDTVEKNVLNCIREISEQNESICKEFDALPIVYVFLNSTFFQKYINHVMMHFL